MASQSRPDEVEISESLLRTPLVREEDSPDKSNSTNSNDNEELQDTDEIQTPEVDDVVELEDAPLPTPPEQSEPTQAPQSPEISEEDWHLDRPTSPSYSEYTGHPKYARWIPGPELTVVSSPYLVTRSRAQDGLKYQYCLRKHLSAILSLFAKHGEEQLRTPPSQTALRSQYTTSLEDAQNTFAIHHIGISETLLRVPTSVALGLPANNDYRIKRNHFAHAFGTPEMLDATLAECMQGKERYARLLAQVEKTIEVLEDQLADSNEWSRPLPKPKQVLYLPVIDTEEVDQDQDQDEQDEWSCLGKYNPVNLMFRSKAVRWAAKKVEDWLYRKRTEAEDEPWAAVEGGQAERDEAEQTMGDAWQEVQDDPWVPEDLQSGDAVPLITVPHW
jgi:hypothetical protein